MRGKKYIPLTREEAGKAAMKKIPIIIIIGVILMIADFAICNSREAVKIMESNGSLYLIRPPEGSKLAYASLVAKVQGEDLLVEKQVNVELEPYGGIEDDAEEETNNEELQISDEERIAAAVADIAAGFNDDLKSDKVWLPTELESGETIDWKEEEGSGSNGFAIAMMTMLVIFGVYKSRFSAIEKQEKRNRESVMIQLPEFVNRLVLLLNAGMVLTSAFEKSIEESMNFKNCKDDYFYGKMQEIYVSVKTANGAMHEEFGSFAKESGIRELMRVSNIISDNIKKGVELTDKLQTESRILWHSRKKNCEEKSRLAETKLTMPLIIFLMVLITITVAPALLEL